MKKIFTLLAILAGLVGAAVYYEKEQSASLNTAASKGVKLREYLLPDLDRAAVRKFRIHNGKDTVTIQISDDQKQLTLAERGGYPASMEKVSTALDELAEQKISNKAGVAKSAWSKNKLNAPGDGAEGVGTQVELIGSADKPLATLILGNNVDISGGATSTPMMGGNTRLIRIPSDADTIWNVSNTFYDLEAKPENWLDKSFIDTSKIKELSVTAANKEDSWKVAKKAETEAEFYLADAAAGQSLDTTKLPGSSVLASPSFTDVHAKEKAAELLKDSTAVKVVTFDGFSYDLALAKQGKAGEEKYYLSVNVSAEIPASRSPVKDEKEEDKKKADEAFATAKKAKEDRLAKEQKCSGWVYEVSEYTINNLLKKRNEILKLDVPPAQPAAGN
jgi:Domain of unknown function (DUF4340)